MAMRAAQRQSIPIVGETSTSRSIKVNDQDTVNLVQSIKRGGAKGQYVLESAPGQVSLDMVGDGPIRTPQMVSANVRGAGFDLYGVWGSKLIAQTVSSGNIEVGTLNTSTGTVVITRGRNYVFLVDGTNGYTYDGTTFAVVTDAAFPGVSSGSAPTHPSYIDGFFIVNDPSTDNWYLSSSEDPTSWNALEFDAASVSPDNALAHTNTASLLWILGQETAEAYYNSEDPNFPYAIALEATQDYGILAPYSLAKSGEGIFYLATTAEGGRFIYHIAGQAGRVISGEEQQEFLYTIEDPTTATGFIYKQNGKSFYVLQLGASVSDEPDGTRSSNTLIYNITAQRFERREMADGSAWRVGGVGMLNNKVYAGSRLQGEQIELRLDNFEDLGTPMRRYRRTQVYHDREYLMDWWEVEVICKSGVGNFSGAGQDPMLRLRYSDDFGYTWSDWLEEPLGKIGQYNRRAVFRNLGASRNRMLEISCDEPVPVTIIGAVAVLERLDD